MKFHMRVEESEGRYPPRGVYQLPMIVSTPTAKGDSSMPMMKRRAKTALTLLTDAKQKVTIDQRSSTVGM
jgi:hypothetical protein